MAKIIWFLKMSAISCIFRFYVIVYKLRISSFMKCIGTSTVRERRKEPREGSEIEPEIVCIQAVGADLFRDCVPFV